MFRRILLVLAVSLLAGTVGSCAVTESADGSLAPSAYAPRAQDPARLGLPPMYRPFFDELKDDGDWTLIEPYGYCFRPRANFVAWRPYLEGWWDPSDTWGWIWNSNEPWGWITYHYGSWFYDSYQGWVWQPGAVWGPAWVAWVETGDYVGWAPLGPSAWNGFADVPGGMFTYAGARQLTSRDIGQQALYLTRLPESSAPAREIVNVGHANGVVFNRGPDIARLAQMGAPIPPRVDDTTLPRVPLAGTPARPSEADLQARTSRVAAEAAREWRALREQGITPPAKPADGAPLRSPVPHPALPKVTAPAHPHAPAASPKPRETRPLPAAEPARRDSTAAGDRAARPGRDERPERPADRDSTRDH